MARIRRVLSLPSIDNSKNKGSFGDTRRPSTLPRVTVSGREWTPDMGVPPWNQPTRRK